MFSVIVGDPHLVLRTSKLLAVYTAPYRLVLLIFVAAHFTTNFIKHLEQMLRGTPSIYHHHLPSVELNLNIISSLGLTNTDTQVHPLSLCLSSTHGVLPPATSCRRWNRKFVGLTGPLYYFSFYLQFTHKISLVYVDKKILEG